jgi:hypothetical protein
MGFYTEQVVPRLADVTLRSRQLARLRARVAAGLEGEVLHGRAPDPGVARWQDRLTPLQRRLAGGCHLNRPIREIVAGGGLQIDELDTYYIRGPRPLGHMYEGTATRP